MNTKNPISLTGSASHHFNNSDTIGPQKETLISKQHNTRKKTNLTQKHFRKAFHDTMPNSSFGHHPGDEILIPDLPIGPNIDLPDPLVKLSRLELLANAGENVAEIGDGDEASGILIENLEGIAELAIEGLGFHVLGHEVEESGEIKRGGEVFLGDDLFKLGLGRVAA